MLRVFFLMLICLSEVIFYLLAAVCFSLETLISPALVEF